MSSTAPSVGGRPAAPRHPFGDYYLVALIVVVTLTGVIPAMAIAGFIDITPPSCAVATLIALAGGIAGGALGTPKLFSWKAILVVTAYNVALLWTTIVYLLVRTTPVLKIELAVPLLFAALPAAGLYAMLARQGAG